MTLPQIPPIHRLRVNPDEPADGPPAIDGDRPRGSRRPHNDVTVAAVRHLVEKTTLSFAEIAAWTGASRPSISRWTRDGGWQRSPFAPRSSELTPTARAGAKLKIWMLAGRLRTLAERMVRELEEETPGADLDKLMQALQVLKMARLEAQGRRGRRKLLSRAETGHDRRSREDAIRAALKDMHRGGVDIDRTPQEALDLVIDANLPVEQDHPALRPRGARRRRRRR